MQPRALLRRLCLAALLLGVAAAAPLAARAQGRFMFASTPYGVQQMVLDTGGSTVTLDAVAAGWWDSSGLHEAININYGVGFEPGGPDHRDFFVFDLSGVQGPITAASLSIGNPPGGFGSPYPYEVFSMVDVSTPIDTLIADGTGRTGIYDDLGSGVLFASRRVSPADDATQVLVGLDAAAVAALNAAAGSRFALGGRLDFAAVPEPGASALLSGGSLGAAPLALRCRRGRRRAA